MTLKNRSMSPTFELDPEFHEVYITGINMELLPSVVIELLCNKNDRMNKPKKIMPSLTPRQRHKTNLLVCVFVHWKDSVMSESLGKSD